MARPYHLAPRGVTLLVRAAPARVVSRRVSTGIRSGEVTRAFRRWQPPGDRLSPRGQALLAAWREREVEPERP